MSAPDLTRKVIGFRRWRLVDGQLRPSNPRLRNAWKIGVNRARCDAHKAGKRGAQRKSHRAPARFCACGLHAWHDHWSQEDTLTPWDGWILGAVAAWGDIEVHHTGFRAQFMEPIVFGYHGGLTLRAFEAGQRFSHAHGFRFLPLDELKEFALGYGDVIPLAMRPGAKKKTDPLDVRISKLLAAQQELLAAQREEAARQEQMWRNFSALARRW